MTSKFITENELKDVRKKRQEEWERVRKPDDPLERPEDPYDNRSLFDRLQDQKTKKDLEYAEAHKLKNLIKGLDDDEIDFLDLVDRSKQAADRRKELEDKEELSDYRNRVALLQETEEANKVSVSIAGKSSNTSAKPSSQQALLKGGIKRKSNCDITDFPKPPAVKIPSVGALPGLASYTDSSSDSSDVDSA